MCQDDEGVSCYCSGVAVGGSKPEEGVTNQVFHTSSLSQGLPFLLMAPSWCLLLISALAQPPKRSIYGVFHLTGGDQRGKNTPKVSQEK